MLSSLLLANKRILSCFFFFFLVMFNSFLIIPVVSVYVITAFDYIDKIKVKLALAIPAGAPITLADAMT